MKVAIVNTGDAGGGAERVAWELFEGLQRRSIETRFFCAKPVMPESRKLLGWVDWVLGRLCKRVGFADVFSFRSWNIIKDAEFGDADLVHLHNIHGFYFGVIPVLRIARRKPCVWTLHDFWALTGGCYHPAGCERWLQQCGSCPQHGVFPMVGALDTSRSLRALKRRALNAVLSTGAVSCPSQWLSGEARRVAGQYEERIRTIRNPVDTTQFTPGHRAGARSSLGLRSDDFVVAIAAVDLTNWMKGIKAAVEAVIMANRSHPVAVILIGGNDAEASALLEGVRHVRMGQLKERSSMAQGLSAADVCVVASVAESFCLVAAEALACGTPVVAFAGHGLNDLVFEGQTGYLLGRGDVAGMSACVVSMARNPAQCREMRRESRAFAEREFGLDKFIGSYVDLYSEVLGR